jgi:hypothetical protein
MQDITQPAGVAAAPAAPSLRPKGIGMAVAFDWGLAVQLLVTPFLPLLLGSFKHARNSPTIVSVLLSLLMLLVPAAICVVFGEGVRRGWRWTRFVQIGVNALGFLGGFFSLFSSIPRFQHGNYWSLTTVIILLIFSPLIAWRLSRSETAQWFAQVSSTDARKRHGGMWPFYIALWALVGGVLQALAVFFA